MTAVVDVLPDMGARFSDSFWDKDDRGVEVITEKLRASRQTCEEIMKLYEIRAEIEADYGERLLKLSQMMVGQAEEGTLSESISHIPSAIETTARAHLDLSSQLQQHLEAPLASFVKDQTERRKAQYQQIENSKQLKSMHYANVERSRDYYTAECTKLTGMEKYLTERRSEMAADEAQQVEEEIEEQKKLVAAADQEYKHAVTVLNDVTDKWISDWRSTCDTFQDLEETRIDFIRSSLWAFANIMSSVYIVDDQCCERIRTALESTDVQKDIALFVERYGTGNKVTSKTRYRNHFDPTSPQSATSSHGVSSPASPLPQTSPPAPTVTPIPAISPPVHAEKPPSPPAPVTFGPSSQPPILPAEPGSRLLLQKPPMSRTVSDTALDAPQRQETGPARAMSDPTLLDDPQEQQQRRSVPAIAIQRDSPQDSVHGYDFVEYAQHDDEAHDHHDTMSFAFKEIETMLDDVGTQLDATSLGAQARSGYTPLPQPAPERQPAAASAVMTNAPFVTKEEPSSAPTDARENVPPQAQDIMQKDPTLSDQSQTVMQESSLAPNSTNGDANSLRLKPVPNPQYSANGDAAEAPRSIPPPSTPAPGPVTQDNDESSEDEEEPLPVRRRQQPKPKEEKWTISSIRRPQQMPVRIQDARMYERQSQQGIPAPRLTIDTSLPPQQQQQQQQPQPKLRQPMQAEQPSQQAAHGLIDAVRAQLQSSPSEASVLDENPGIRPAPWQDGQVQQHPQPQAYQPPPSQQQYRPEEPRYFQQQGTGMKRQNSVAGPRAPSIKRKSHVPPMPDAANMYAFENLGEPKPQPSSKGNPSTSSQDIKASEGVRSFMKKALDPRGESPSNKDNKGRFSFGMFGKKRRDDELKTKEEIVDIPPSLAAAQRSEVREEPHQHDPSKLSDGTPVLHYVRSMWSYEAKIPSEVSFDVGDVFGVIRKQPDGWWEAERMDPKRKHRGLIPGNYMENI
ncbi:hypothetical protein BCR43DRAFT_519788 [Syncephalastrum racemosum]|uniref:SH3 domain-containing protein n=1 Tax=Syncephalastrum racemosum TaxID=13706 RepID=A0A1X2HSD9_SYNRA|nr:hypothetical protein BCR43DRAFT_519788 [Syncephalastrum racemosum]